jgi:hypothetical protein
MVIRPIRLRIEMAYNEEFLRTPIGSVLAESRDIFKLLYEDVELAERMWSEQDSQFWRRTFIRSVFALIEGFTYRLKQVALEASKKFSIELSKSEIALLLEESYEVNDKGHAETKPDYIQLPKNIKFAFRMYSHAYSLNYQLKIDDDGWLSFKEALKVRNRLTHPKSTSDVSVSDQDMSYAETAAIWFVKSSHEIQRAMVEEMKVKLEAKKKASAPP